jgi:hypothetical protein
MKKIHALLILSALLLCSCGATVTYTDPETGISVTEVVDGKLRPKVDFSKVPWFRWFNPDNVEGLTLEPAK